MNLKKLEKNTAAVIFQTGIVEIGIGLVWIVSSLAMIFDDISYYIDILFVVPIIFIILANQIYCSSAYGNGETCQETYEKKHVVHSGCYGIFSNNGISQIYRRRSYK